MQPSSAHGPDKPTDKANRRAVQSRSVDREFSEEKERPVSSQTHRRKTTLILAENNLYGTHSMRTNGDVAHGNMFSVKEDGCVVLEMNRKRIAVDR